LRVKSHSLCATHLFHPFSLNFCQFMSFSLLVCNWPHSVGQNHFFVKDATHFAIQKCFQKILHSLQSQKILFPVSCLDDVSYRPDTHLSKASSVPTTWIPVQTILCVEKLRNSLACIRPDDSAARPDDSQCSIKPQDFFPKHRYGKITATIRTMWIPVRTLSSIRQISQFKSRCSDASHYGPNARASYMKIACIRSAVQTTILLVRMNKASIWKLLAADVRPFGRQGTTVRTWLISGKNFNEILGQLIT